MKPDFQDYAKQILFNAKALSETLQDLGFILQGNGTDNHMILIDTKTSFDINGKFYEIALDQVGLTLNANTLKNDKSGAFRPSGVRLGTPAITTRGLKEPEMKQIAIWLEKVAKICQKAENPENLTNFTSELEQIHTEVKTLSLKFPLPSKSML